MRLFRLLTLLLFTLSSDGLEKHTNRNKPSAVYKNENAYEAYFPEIRQLHALRKGTCHNFGMLVHLPSLQLAEGPPGITHLQFMTLNKVNCVCQTVLGE